MKGWVLLVVAAIPAAMLADPSPARAALGSSVPTYNEVAVEELSTPAGEVGALVNGAPSPSAQGPALSTPGLSSGTFDAELDSVVVHGDTMVKSFEEARGRLSNYVFDPLNWRASGSGVVPSFVERDTYHFQDGAWQPIASRSADSTASISIVWQGSGPAVVTRSVEPDGVCVIPPSSDETCLPRLHAGRWRQAVVSGWMTFNGLGVSVRLPSNQRGWMAYGSP